MPSLMLSDRLIWFAHCPKAGGTSVEQMMVARWGRAVSHLHWGWDRWWHRGGWRVANPPNSPQHLVWRDACRALDKTPDVVFAVVRDPVTRMASEHRYQRRHRRGRRLGRLLAHLPFDPWLRLMLAVARINPHAFDNHFRPQAEFVPEGAVVFRLENGLGPVAVWLGEVTGEAMPEAAVPHALPSGCSKGCPPMSAARIAEAFAEDYARFGYARPEGADTPLAPPGAALCLVARLVAWAERRGQV